MDYRNARSLASTIAWVAGAITFAIVAFVVTPGFGIVGRTVLCAAVFVMVFQIQQSMLERINDSIYHKRFNSGMTKHVSHFIERVRTCFTLQDFILALKEGMERVMDASTLLIRSNTWDIIYSSPTILTTDPTLLGHIKRNFRELSEGMGFVDDGMNLSSGKNGSRGFFMFCKGYYLFIFSRALSWADTDSFRILFGELLIFFDRVLTVNKLFEIATLSKEWRLIAETQRSFLPAKLPEPAKLSLAHYFRPLVNVSGDFYDAIVIDDARTLLVLGDVAGKGLGAALIMGIVINTIRNARDKTDLAALVVKCHSAIQEMGFDDKYTVMFLGIADTEHKKFKFVNAAMPDQYIIVRTVKGPQVKRLESNASIIGLVSLEEIEPEEIELRTDDVILLSTDGLTELENEKGGVLEDSSAFHKILEEANSMEPEELIERLATLGETFTGQKKLRDDITMLAAKVGRLWD